MIAKLTRVVFFWFIILSLSLTGCLKSETGTPLSPPVIPPTPTFTAEVLPTASMEAQAPTPTTVVPEVPFYQYVPGGQFLMGSQKDDSLAKEDEFPQHVVRLPGYWIYTNEVNNDLYAQCVAAGKCSEPAKSDTGPKSHYGNPEYKDFPVVGVTWNQADTFCKTYDAHLPTEAEWEKAARGFFAFEFPWGNQEATCDLSNLSGCKKDVTKVGSYDTGKSPFELRDMAGNVREWTSDWYKADAYQTAQLFMPVGPEIGQLKVVRGGSYLDSVRDVRTAARFAYDPEREFEDVGFRCVPNEHAISAFCSSTYRPSCSPARPGKPPDQCNPGEITGGGISSKVSLSCPDSNGMGKVKVVTSEKTNGIIVSINGNGSGITCTGVGTNYVCTGPIPTSGTQVTVEVCVNTGNAFNPEFGVHYVTCETFTLPISIGDTIKYPAGGEPSYFQAGMALIPELIQVSNNCPNGYTWDTKLGQCVRIPGTVPEAPQGTCADGYVMDPNLGCCVPGTLDNGGCLPGYYHSLAADLCIPIEQNGCPVGYTYDPYLGCMLQVHQGDDVNGCPPGTHLLPDGKTCEVDSQAGNLHVTCPPGSDYVEGKGCVTSTVGTPPVQCPEGTYYDYTLKICMKTAQDGCPPGTYLDEKLKQCLPSTGPWTGCPPNYLINPNSGCCVPAPGADNTDCIGYQDGQDGGSAYDPAQVICPPPVDVACPPGYILSEAGDVCVVIEGCPPGTGPTPNNPNGCFPSGTEPCPQGYEMSNSGLGCVPIMMDSVQYQCAPSQYFDPVMGLCLDRTEDCCAEGFNYSVKDQMCIPILQNGNYCPPGWIWDGAEGCAPVIQQGANCTSFDLTVPSCTTNCPKGYEWNANKGACVKITNCAAVNCPTSTTCPASCCRREPTGKCVKK